MTLKDQAVLDDGEDVLVNVNITDEERYQRNILNKTKKPGYDAYDDDNFDEFGFPKKIVLEKYDEEIEGEKKDTFVLGVNSAKESKQAKLDYVKQRLANKRLESLQLAEPKLASEYYNDEELLKFKKPKKKVNLQNNIRYMLYNHVFLISFYLQVRKIRKKLKADDLIPEDNDYLRDLGSRRSRRPEETKPDNDSLDVDDIGGI